MSAVCYYYNTHALPRSKCINSYFKIIYYKDNYMHIHQFIIIYFLFSNLRSLCQYCNESHLLTQITHELIMQALAHFFARISIIFYKLLLFLCIHPRTYTQVKGKNHLSNASRIYLYLLTLNLIRQLSQFLTSVVTLQNEWI